MCLSLAAGAPEFFMECVHIWRDGHDDPHLFGVDAPTCPVTIEAHARDLMLEMVRLQEPERRERVKDEVSKTAMYQILKKAAGGSK